MRLTRFLAIVAVTALVVGLLAWQLDPGGLLWRVAETQREIQNTMASALRAIQSGDPWALLGLCGLTFAYGFVHAIGPGHGKFLIGGAAFARRARLRRLSLLTLASSLGQSVTAVLMVLAGTGLVALTGRQLVDFTESFLAPASYGAVALIGAWLACRGVRGLWRALPRQSDLDCSGTLDGDCGCGHRHGPSPAEIDDAMSGREMIALVLSIALRPCTGALFLLVIAWRFHILPAGIVATFSMGLGTASFNLMMAGTGLGLHLALTRIGTVRFSRFIAPVTSIFAGMVVSLASGSMLWRLV